MSTETKNRVPYWILVSAVVVTALGLWALSNDNKAAPEQIIAVPDSLVTPMDTQSVDTILLGD